MDEKRERRRREERGKLHGADFKVAALGDSSACLHAYVMFGEVSRDLCYPRGASIPESSAASGWK